MSSLWACGSDDKPPRDDEGEGGEGGSGCAGEVDVCGVCDGPGPLLWYADLDHDGLGDPNSVETACERPADYVDNPDDDAPGCVGMRVWYRDQDEDELGDPSSPEEACAQPAGFVRNHDDAEPDCATNDSDECGVCAGSGPRSAYPDADGDGLGDPSVELEICDLPDGWVRNDDDDEPDCETNDIDDCGVCGGDNESIDCAGVCGGEAEEDGCGRCAGGTTGVEPSVTDSDDDGIPDACDGCVAPGVGRMIVQWTNVEPFGPVFGGPYKFQALLFENGEFAYLYNDVDPFGDATITVGYQGVEGANPVELAYGSRYPRAYPVVYFARSSSGGVAVEYNIDVPWNDIAETGTRLPVSDDTHLALDLPFDFPFDGETYDSVEVSDNGFILLGGDYPADGGFANEHIPAETVGALLAVFWDDLDPSAGRISYQFMDGSCAADCSGAFGGVAELDDCGVCSGGDTGLRPNADKDCAGVCFGEASLDVCQICSGGTTGKDPSDPNDCPSGPDLLVDAAYMRSTIEQDFIDVPENSCFVNEGCVTGTGMRRVVRFGTRIANVGNSDLALGTPDSSNPIWTWDPCHGHYHFQDYADYDLIPVSSSMTQPIGSKNGFCVLDLETWDPELATNDCDHYTCENQGISVGCADIYDSALNCQWIDITGVASGEYDVRVTTNPRSEIPELDYTNNSATVRIEITAGGISLVE
ncbi:MAG TPA: lysyl oxidase family protein [Polyangiaceae bacterium]